MEWILFVLSGALLGPLIYWLALWLPHRIEAEETAWIKQSIDVEHTLQFHKPKPLWVSAYWSTARKNFLFWIAIIGAPAISVAFAYKFSASPAMPALVFFGIVIFALAITDQYSQLLPDNLTLTLMWIGMLMQLLPGWETIGIHASVIGAAIGYMLLWLAAKMFLLLRKQEGLGHGDMKLLAAGGAWLGPMALPLAIVIGSGLAILYQGTRIVLKKTDRSELFAFGPWLAMGLIAAALLV